MKVVLFLSPIMPYLREAAHTAHRTKQEGPGPSGVKSPLRGLVFTKLICENKFSEGKSDNISSEGTIFSSGKKLILKDLVLHTPSKTQINNTYKILLPIHLC